MENLWYCAVNEYVKYPIPRTIPSTSRQVVLEKLWSRYYLKLVKTSSGFSRQFICLYFSYNFLLAFSWDFLEWMGKIFNATIRPRLESFMDSNIWNIWILIIWFCLVINVIWYILYYIQTYSPDILFNLLGFIYAFNAQSILD